MEFLDVVEKAEAEAISQMSALIQTAATKSWQAAAWYLERKLPQEFGRYQRLVHSGPEEGPIQSEKTVFYYPMTNPDDPS